MADGIMKGVLLAATGVLIVLGCIQLAGLSGRVFRGRAIERTRRQEIAYGLVALVMGGAGIIYAATWDPNRDPSTVALVAQVVFVLALTASVALNFATMRRRQPNTTGWEFNSPPGWPPAPAGWRPGPGWQPDSAWPAPPADWQWWVPAGQHDKARA